MMQELSEYERGVRKGIQAAVTWLHQRATEMNDPHARSVLDSAATNLGWDAARGQMLRHPRLPQRFNANSDKRLPA